MELHCPHTGTCLFGCLPVWLRPLSINFKLAQLNISSRLHVHRRHGEVYATMEHDRRGRLLTCRQQKLCMVVEFASGKGRTEKMLICSRDHSSFIKRPQLISAVKAGSVFF